MEMVIPFVKFVFVYSENLLLETNFQVVHGQKGTIGIIIPEEDMPFTADGINQILLLIHMQFRHE